MEIDGEVLGAPAYHPRALLSVWLYGFMTGVRSCRKLEAACRDQIPYLWLTGWHTTALTPQVRRRSTMRQQKLLPVTEPLRDTVGGVHKEWPKTRSRAIYIYWKTGSRPLFSSPPLGFSRRFVPLLSASADWWASAAADVQLGGGGLGAAYLLRLPEESRSPAYYSSVSKAGIAKY